MNASNYTNHLIHEKSLYLQQHAHNPVDWFPWGTEAFEKAKRENKPIILSIGYSSCHWCHVMERESFENEDLAKLMNDHFISIKVDREERPDVDQIYMEAVQAMGLQGGWPLNVFLMPDGNPFYGGTYFKAEQWSQLLEQINIAYRDNWSELNKSAQSFNRALNQSETEKYRLSFQTETEYSEEKLDEMYVRLSKRFDEDKGGLQSAPKFPMPVIWEFMLTYFHVSQNYQARKQLVKTLDEISMGGIYDQVGGGFARYSVDANWFAPHFEKMLYDNAQLLSLYAKTYAITQNKDYKRIMHQTVEFLEREMKSEGGGYYSALDADSEGVEGLFYIWEWEELQRIFEEDELLKVAEYYNIYKGGNWEHGRSILFRTSEDSYFEEKWNMDSLAFQNMLDDWRERLLEKREEKIRPGLDTKIILGWNALLLKAFSEMYRATSEESYLQKAIELAEFIDDKMTDDSGELFRISNQDEVSGEAFLEDYAALIQAYFHVYQATQDEKWLKKAIRLLDLTISNFYDTEEKMFFFSGSQSEQLIARKKEIFDNVIPSSNGLMAYNLYFLGHITENKTYLSIFDEMMSGMGGLLETEIVYLSQWANLYAMNVQPMTEVAVIGEDAIDQAKSLHVQSLINCVIQTNHDEGRYPLLQNRTAIDGKTTFYVCQNKACQLPVFSVEEAKKLMIH